MVTLAPTTTPFYGGGQVANPANVIPTSGAPSTKLTHLNLGTLAVDNAAGTIYGLVSQSGGSALWAVMGGAASVVDTINTLPPTGGNITIAGTSNQIGVANAGSTVTLSLPSAITAPGSITATTTVVSTTTMTAGTGFTVTSGGAAITGTTTINNSGAGVTTIGTGGSGATNIGNATGNTAVTGSLTASTTLTATLGAITATNGNLVMGTIGNKIVVPTGTNASAGTSGAMSGTPGVVTVSTTASSATAKVFYCRNATGGTPGNVSITAQDGTGFTLTSTANETSTFNWWIINA